MNRRLLQALLVGVIAIGFAAAGYGIFQWRHGASGEGPPQDAVAIGQMVLEAQLLGLDGQPHALAQWRGKVLVVNFWATWCAPCREEIPTFINFQRLYEARGVQFVGIALDHKSRVEPYAKELGINYPLLVGGMETMDFARQLGNRQGVLPYTLILDRTGKVATSVVGVLKPERLERSLLSLSAPL